MITVQKIVEAFLRAHGYDGIYNDNIPCGCHLGDLAPCGECSMGCIPGFFTDPPDEWSEMADYWIGPCQLRDPAKKLTKELAKDLNMPEEYIEQVACRLPWP
jgi:hypothetical protein